VTEDRSLTGIAVILAFCEEHLFVSNIAVKAIADLRGKLVEYHSEPGAEQFVRNALLGRDYPAVYPDVFQPHTILDVGSHVGAAALYFRYVYPRARIYCFEPNPVTFALLHRNVSDEHGIEARQMALGCQNSQMRLFSGVYSSLQASLVPNEENRSDGPTVEVRAIDEILQELKIGDISVLKIDTEGMELPILRSLGNRIALTDVIYLEYHSESDRREIDRMLADRFILFASQVSVPDRGTVCYVAVSLVEDCRVRSSQPRFAFTKRQS
jgi:FkbM family methyltransferase